MEKRRESTRTKNCIYRFAYFLFDTDEILGIRGTRNDRFFEKPVTYRGYMRSVSIARKEMRLLSSRSPAVNLEPFRANAFFGTSFLSIIAGRYLTTSDKEDDRQSNEGEMRSRQVEDLLTCGVREKVFRSLLESLNGEILAISIIVVYSRMRIIVD